MKQFCIKHAFTDGEFQLYLVIYLSKAVDNQIYILTQDRINKILLQ